MILITGASKGIGKYLLERYANENQLVFGTYNNTEPTSFIDKYNKVDIRSISSIYKWINSRILEMERITLINCAAINYNFTLHGSDTGKWADVIYTNVIGTYNVIRMLLPTMRISNYGRIINLSSILATEPIFGTSAYATSKSALNGLIKSLAVENASKGITANNINLGYIDSGMTYSEITDDAREDIIQNIPAKRLGKLEEVYDTIEFIRNNQYINGTSINLNGGL